MNKAEPWQLEIIAICTWCLGQQHFGPGPAGVQACETRDCECWCRSSNEKAPELRVIGKSVCNEIAGRLVALGYIDTTGQHVADQLAKPAGQRNIIGTIAADALKSLGVVNWRVDYS